MNPEGRPRRGRRLRSARRGSLGFEERQHREPPRRPRSVARRQRQKGAQARGLCHRRHPGAPIGRSVPPKAKAALSVAASGDISPRGREEKRRRQHRERPRRPRSVARRQRQRGAQARRLCHRRHEGAPIWRSVPPKAKAALSVAAARRHLSQRERGERREGSADLPPSSWSVGGGRHEIGCDGECRGADSNRRPERYECSALTS